MNALYQTLAMGRYISDSMKPLPDEATASLAVRYKDKTIVSGRAISVQLFEVHATSARQQPASFAKVLPALEEYPNRLKRRRADSFTDHLPKGAYLPSGINATRYIDNLIEDMEIEQLLQVLSRLKVCCTNVL